jgi:ubiquinone/menaquinone biosynthesis C-methylase UbiE
MDWVEKIAANISAKSREHKYAEFIAKCRPTPGDTILDIGVNTTEYSPSDNYLEKHYPHKQNITAVGIEDGSTFTTHYPEITYLQTDGRSLPFTDNQFSIAYSNAVLEHVGGREEQIAFLREAFRVAKKGFLTTPNRYFPIELHTRIPLLHLLLPKSRFDAFLRMIGKTWATGDYMHLLSERDLRSLLSLAGIHEYELIRNRFLVLTMTFTVTWDKTATH